MRNLNILLILVISPSSAKESEVESKDDFSNRVISDNSPPFSKSEIQNILNYMMINPSGNIINHPDHGKAVVP